MSGFGKASYWNNSGSVRFSRRHGSTHPRYEWGRCWETFDNLPWLSGSESQLLRSPASDVLHCPIFGKSPGIIYGPSRSSCHVYILIKARIIVEFFLSYLLSFVVSFAVLPFSSNLCSLGSVWIPGITSTCLFFHSWKDRYFWRSRVFERPISWRPRKLIPCL